MSDSKEDMIIDVAVNIMDWQVENNGDGTWLEPNGEYAAPSDWDPSEIPADCEMLKARLREMGNRLEVRDCGPDFEAIILTDDKEDTVHDVIYDYTEYGAVFLAAHKLSKAREESGT